MEIGFENFDIKGDHYARFLLDHCASTSNQDYSGHRIVLNLLEVNKRLYQRCQLEYKDQRQVDLFFGASSFHFGGVAAFSNRCRVV